MKSLKYIVGIDEAGRGPLAGPVALGAFCIQIGKYKDKKIMRLFKGARDSKKMTEKKREEIFEKIKLARREEYIRYTVYMQNAKVIDKKGISWAIKDCIKKCLKHLKVPPKQTLVLLDGGIKAPDEFVNQKTIIGGDDKEIVISLASICAKVSRDVFMKKMSKKYPKYGFEVHKGYGTVTHRKSIEKNGPSDLHRLTYLKNIKY